MTSLITVGYDGSPESVAAAGRPDLLVVGRHSRAGVLGAHLGPIAQAAVHHVHSLLAVVPYG